MRPNPTPDKSRPSAASRGACGRKSMKKKPKSRSGPTIPESERAKRGQVRVRLSREAVEAMDYASLPGESRQHAAIRLVILGAKTSEKTNGC